VREGLVKLYLFLLDKSHQAECRRENFRAGCHIVEMTISYKAERVVGVVTVTFVQNNLSVSRHKYLTTRETAMCDGLRCN
jgi:hypothetical protein